MLLFILPDFKPFFEPLCFGGNSFSNKKTSQYETSLPISISHIELKHANAPYYDVCVNAITLYRFISIDLLQVSSYSLNNFNYYKSRDLNNI